MWMHMYVEMHVCEHVQARRYPECSSSVVGAKKSFLLFMRQGLSLAWNSPSRPGWLASEPLMSVGVTCVCHLALDPFSTWILRIKFWSSHLQGNRFNN